MLKIILFLLCCFVFAYNYMRKRIVSSASFWTFCYMLIFLLYPLSREEKWFVHALEIDIYAVVGMICFILGLCLFGRVNLSNGTVSKYNLGFPAYSVNKRFFCFFYLLSLVSLFYSFGSGSVNAVLSGALSSKRLILDNNAGGFFTLSVHLIVPFVLVLWFTAENKREKLFSCFAFLAYSLVVFVFGFTRIFFITVLGIITLYELRKKGINQQVVIVLIGIVGITLTLALMNFIRTFSVYGLDKLQDIWNIDYIFQSTDFGASYYWFNRLLDFESPFINPVVYLKPIFALIPRTIFEFKPEPLSLQILKYTDPSVVATGYTTAGNTVLGEGYAVLGIFGIVIYPLIWGILCRKMDENYYARIKLGCDLCFKDLVYYLFTVFIIISAQRGDWSQYMTIVFWFYLLPIYMLTKFKNRI